MVKIAYMIIGMAVLEAGSVGVLWLPLAPKPQPRVSSNGEGFKWLP